MAVSHLRFSSEAVKSVDVTDGVHLNFVTEYFEYISNVLRISLNKSQSINSYNVTKLGCRGAKGPQGEQKITMTRPSNLRGASC